MDESTRAADSLAETVVEDAPDLVGDELVEDVSIDGMCGVY